MPGSDMTQIMQPADVHDLLLSISRELAGAQSLEQLLQTMANAALRIAPSSDKCVIHLLEAGDTLLRARICSQPALIQEDSPPIPAGMGVAGRALREKVTICLDDVTLAPDFVPLRSGSEVRSLLVAPLYVAEKPLGTLSLSSAQVAAFGADDREHIRTLAAQAAVAIHQAQLLLEAITQRERSEAIIESMADGLVILNGAGEIVRLNLALYRMLQLGPQALDLPCHPESPACPACLRMLLDPSAGLVLGAYEIELPSPEQERVTLHVTPSPLQSPAVGEVRLVHDTTPERRSAQARALFTSQIAHELRTPLQHILGFVGLLAEFHDLSQEDRQRFYEQIQDGVDHLARLVDDLAQLARIEAGRFATHPERVRVDILVAHVVDRLHPRAQLKELDLRLHNATQPLWAWADAQRLEQVLCNLLENAFKYVPAGEQVSVTVEPALDSIVVHVADSGPGIPAEALSHLFDSFYQVKGHKNLRSMGMGLGLYISREIMRALQGEIWVDSQLGVGTTFSLRLPRIVDQQDTQDL